MDVQLTRAARQWQRRQAPTRSTTLHSCCCCCCCCCSPSSSTVSPWLFRPHHRPTAAPQTCPCPTPLSLLSYKHHFSCMRLPPTAALTRIVAQGAGELVICRGGAGVDAIDRCKPPQITVHLQGRAAGCRARAAGGTAAGSWRARMRGEEGGGGGGVGRERQG